VKCLIVAIFLCLALAGALSGTELAPNNLSGCVGCNSDSANVTENQTHIDTYIFIQEGSGGSLVNDSIGNYTLTMTDVVPYTIFFADRPARDVGFAPMDKFLKGFDFGARNPPNAALILPEENETYDQVIVELTNPQYDNATGTLTYTASLLKEYAFQSGWLEDQRSRADASIPEKFGRVVLVIDFCPCRTGNSLFQCGPNAATPCQHSCWDMKKFRCYLCGGGCCGRAGITCSL